MCKKSICFQKLLILFVSVLLLGNCFSAAAFEDVQPVFNSYSGNKIADDLQKVVGESKKDELIPVWIWMEPIERSFIDDLVFQETGMDPAVYENDEQFDVLILPRIKKEICEEIQIEMDSNGKYEKLESFQIALKEELCEVYNSYWQERREIIKREYSLITSSFLRENVPSERTVFYQSKYTSTVAVEATVEEIANYASMQNVSGLSLYIDYETEPDLDIAGSQIGVYCEGGTGFDALDGSWVGCTGIGTKIGIIEAQQGQFDSTAPQLVNNSRLHVLNTFDSTGTITGTIATHATMVTTIIAGRRVLYNGRSFAGIVPAATIYQVPSRSMQSVINGVELLVDEGVSVINYSAGSTTGTAYGSFDKAIDNLIATTGVVFVKSAGNQGSSTGYITSPGKAINAVTVGNAQTKTSSTVAAPLPFSMRNTSSYVEASYLPNKPDISAPGTNISARISSSGVYTGSGTSYAAPMVTGVIAQMFEYKPSLIGHPTRIKACLLLGADSTKISITNNAEVGAQLREKSGAGLVNAIKAVRYGLGEATSITSSAITADTTITSVYCEEGQTIRAIMVYDKQNGGSITGASTFDDYDLCVENQDYGITISYPSSRNNVEIVEYCIEQSGYYDLIVKCNQIVNNSSVPTLTVTYIVDD